MHMYIDNACGAPLLMWLQYPITLCFLASAIVQKTWYRCKVNSLSREFVSQDQWLAFQGVKVRMSVVITLFDTNTSPGCRMCVSRRVKVRPKTYPSMGDLTPSLV